MPTFNYVARDAGTGREVRSSVEASTESSAIASLLNRNMLVISIRENTRRKAKTAVGKVRLDDLVIFTRQLSTMIDAGLAVVQSLQALGDQTSNRAMREIVREVTLRVEGGDSFSEALQRHPGVFNRLYYSMVAAGERGGLLAEILSRLATYLENTARLRKKVKSAMMYPIVVTVVAIAITIFLLVKVVPVFGEIFSGFGSGGLPGPTQFLVNVSDVVKSYYILFILVAGAIGFGWTYYLKTPMGRKFWDSRRIRLPIFGSIAHKICLARFTRTFSSLIRSGVPILEVLSIVQNTVGNVVMEEALKACAQDIERGESISNALSKHPVFPVMIVRMITAGEQTGKIDVMMERVANSLDEEIETILSGLTSLIEPVLIIFLGVVVGGMITCMFLPIFKLSEIASKM